MDLSKRITSVEIIYYFNDFYDNFFDYISNNYKYAYILHDKDYLEDGTLKKEHYHVLLFFDNARYLSSIVKEFERFNINLNQFSFIKNKKKAIRYLIHIDNKNKYHYELSDIISNLEDISSYFNDDNSIEQNDVIKIIEYIKKYPFISFYDLAYYVSTNNLWSTYRRNYSILKDIIYENKLIFDKSK